MRHGYSALDLHLPMGIAMRPDRNGYLIAVLMLAASVGGILARPSAVVPRERLAISLESMIPTQFGDWHEVRASPIQVVNPQAREMLDRLYSQIVSRVYANVEGYRIMLSLAYGSDQRGSLAAHRPEACYPSQGFVLEKNDPAVLSTPFGAIPVRRLFGVRGVRKEPVTYWLTVGDEAVHSTTQKRLVDLRYGLTGRIPDGMLFRVSSLDADQARAYKMQERFINQLLQSLSPADRKRLTGLGDS